MSGCSWQYWCKYQLKLPDKTNDGALKGSIVHLVLECLGKKRHKKHYKTILKTGKNKGEMCGKFCQTNYNTCKRHTKMNIIP